MNNESPKITSSSVFGVAIASILLVLYAYTTLYMIHAVRCDVDTECTRLTKEAITEGMIFVNTMVSGLVAALVVAELAVTKPGETPGTRMFSDSSDTLQWVTNIISAFYIAVWICIGLAALIFGVIFNSGISETLTTTGTTWLGIAVAAGYSYFGIKPAS